MKILMYWTSSDLKFCSMKGTVKRMKREVTDCRKYLQLYIQ